MNNNQESVVDSGLNKITKLLQENPQIQKYIARFLASHLRGMGDYRYGVLQAQKYIEHLIRDEQKQRIHEFLVTRKYREIHCSSGEVHVFSDRSTNYKEVLNCHKCGYRRPIAVHFTPDKEWQAI